MDVKFKADALLFDKDGTLIHYDASWAPYVPKLFEKLAPGRTEIWDEMAQAVGFDFSSKKFAVGSVAVNGTFEEVLKILEKYIGPIEPEAALEADAYAHEFAQPVAVGELNPLLESFKTRGLKLAVATNDLMVPTERQLQIMDNRQLFDTVLCADSGPAPKPSGDMLLAACKMMDVDPARAMMIGDSTHDLHAGRDAKIGFNVGVLTGPASANDIEEIADIILQDIHHLPQILA